MIELEVEDVQKMRDDLERLADELETMGIRSAIELSHVRRRIAELDRRIATANAPKNDEEIAALVAQRAWPLFVQNNWTYQNFRCSDGVPTEEQLARFILDRIENARATGSSESGRFNVVRKSSGIESGLTVYLELYADWDFDDGSRRSTL